MLNRMKLVSFLLLSVLLSLGGLAPRVSAQNRTLVEVGRKTLDFGRYNPREFGWLEVDDTGALYFSSFHKVLKFQPAGPLLYEIDIRKYNARGISDVRVAQDGKLVVACNAPTSRGSGAKTVVLIFNRQGSLIQSFERRDFATEKVETASKGVIFLAGVQLPKNPDQTHVGTAGVYKFSSGGKLLASFGEKTVDLSKGIRGRNPGMAIAKESCWLLDETADGLFLKTFTLDGHLVRSSKIALVEAVTRTEGIEAAKSSNMESVPLITFFQPLNSKLALVATGTDCAREPKERVAQTWKSYGMYLVSADGRTVEPVVSNIVGALRAVGRDGFIYLEKKNIFPDRISVEVIKAVLQ